MASSDIPILRVHPADHEAAKAYYAARRMREGVDYRLAPGHERFPSFGPAQQAYDRFSDL